jgi:hypothetical protein
LLYYYIAVLLYYYITVLLYYYITYFIVPRQRLRSTAILYHQSSLLLIRLRWYLILLNWLILSIVSSADDLPYFLYEPILPQQKPELKKINYEQGWGDYKETCNLEFLLITLSKHHCIHILWENVIYVNCNHQVEYLTEVTILNSLNQC